jgi:hypothetical protein
MAPLSAKAVEVSVKVMGSSAKPAGHVKRIPTKRVSSRHKRVAIAFLKREEVVAFHHIQGGRPRKSRFGFLPLLQLPWFDFGEVPHRMNIRKSLLSPCGANTGRAEERIRKMVLPKLGARKHYRFFCCQR